MSPVAEMPPAMPKNSRSSTDDPLRTTPHLTRPAAGFSKTVVNFWVDLALLVLLGGVSVSAVVVQFVFPHRAAAENVTIWGYSYYAWSRLQFGLTAFFLLGVLLHVMLHWTWVCGVVVGKILRRKGPLVPPDDGTRTLYGVATLIVFLAAVGALVAAAAMGVRPPAP